MTVERAARKLNERKKPKEILQATKEALNKMDFECNFTNIIKLENSNCCDQVLHSTKVQDFYL